MKLKWVGIFVVFLLMTCTAVFSGQIPLKQVSRDITNCQKKLSFAAAQVTYLKVLIGVLDSIRCDTTSLDSISYALKVRKESFLVQIDDHISKGNDLQEKVKTLPGSYCSSCFNSSVRHFCKSIDILQSDIKSCVHDIDSVAVERAALFTPVYMNLAENAVDCKYSQVELSSKNLKKLKKRIEVAKNLQSILKYKEALQYCMEIIDNVYGF